VLQEGNLIGRRGWRREVRRAVGGGFDGEQTDRDRWKVLLDRRPVVAGGEKGTRTDAQEELFVGFPIEKWVLLARSRRHEGRNRAGQHGPDERIEQIRRMAQDDQNHLARVDSVLAKQVRVAPGLAQEICVADGRDLPGLDEVADGPVPAGGVGLECGDDGRRWRRRSEPSGVLPAE